MILLYYFSICLSVQRIIYSTEKNPKVRAGRLSVTQCTQEEDQFTKLRLPFKAHPLRWVHFDPNWSSDFIMLSSFLLIFSISLIIIFFLIFFFFSYVSKTFQILDYNHQKIRIQKDVTTVKLFYENLLQNKCIKISYENDSLGHGILLT